MRLYTDQMGQEIHVSANPQKIISLVPSQTELLFYLGLEDQIKGITKFCIHPQEKVKSVEIIGGTKKFFFDRIHAIQPDLIIGNKEENYQEGIEALQKNYPVWMSDINDLQSALDMILQIGQLTGKTLEAEVLNHQIRGEFDSLQSFVSLQRPLKTLYFIWKKPYMLAGKNTFIYQMMHSAGLINLLESSRYPEIQLEDLKQYQPDLVLLSTEPFPFKDAHLLEFAQIFPKAHIQLVDGEMFSWYGNRLSMAPAYFKSIRQAISKI